MHPTFDTRDQEILTARLQQWNAQPGARVGDFVRFLDGSLHRFTHDWGDGLQTAPALHGSYYFGRGYVSYSGGLDPLIPREQLQLTEDVREGRVWFFHHDYWTADNGVYTMIPCRVFTVITPAPQEGEAMRCDRCDEQSHIHIMSKFNLDILCLACKEDEQHAPNYAKVDAAEVQAVRQGQRHFLGIGLAPEDHAELAARRAAREVPDG